MQKLKLFTHRLKPRNIVEAYVLAVQAAEMNPSSKMQVFQNVINFCEHDVICSKEDTIKRNTLLFWAYDKAAQAEMRKKEYAKALALWLKSCSIKVSPHAHIRLGKKMLAIIDEEISLSVFEKAENLIKITTCLQNAYLEVGQIKEAEKMKRLQQVSAYVLKRSSLKN